jgi:hypothetical protein
LGWKSFPISSLYIPLAQKIVLAAMMISLVLLATRFLKKNTESQNRRQNNRFQYQPYR